MNPIKIQQTKEKLKKELVRNFQPKMEVSEVDMLAIFDHGWESFEKCLQSIESFDKDHLNAIAKELAGESKCLQAGFKLGYLQRGIELNTRINATNARFTQIQMEKAIQDLEINRLRQTIRNMNWRELGPFTINAGPFKTDLPPGTLQKDDAQALPTCPSCYSKNIMVERSPDGKSVCEDCNYSWPHRINVP